MKAYKIVSKEPIIENSLVKIVMAPQNVLEQLSKQDDDDRDNVKYVYHKIDTTNGNALIRNYTSIDDDVVAVDRESIPNGNVKVEVFSLEDVDGLAESIQPKKNVFESTNIQVIAKSHKQPLNMISMEQKNPFNLKGYKGDDNDANTNRDEVEVVLNDLQSIDVEMEHKNTIPAVDSNTMKITSTTEATVIDSAYTDAEELLSNPITSENPLDDVISAERKYEFSEEDMVSTEINSSSLETTFEDLENSSMSSVEVSTKNNVPLVVLKILKNRTILVEETSPQSISDQLSIDTTTIPMVKLPAALPKRISRPTTTTTTAAPKTEKAQQLQFPKKPKLLDPFRQFEWTPKTNLFDVETTHMPPHSENTIKSKNIKRAVGDEGKFSNIVRPSPIRPNWLPQETEAERAERLSKSMQRLMHFVTIAGHVDSYLTKRFRHGLKNVVRLFDSIEEDTRRRRSNL